MADDRVRLDQLAAASDGAVDRAELLDLYKIVIDEYRFEVTLNWQRTQYYFTVNTAVIAVAASMVKVSGLDGWLPPLIVGILFGLGFATARLARRMIEKGHTYYRRAVYKKTLIEHLLGRFQSVGANAHPGANLAIGTTDGMVEAQEILNDPSRYAARSPSINSVTRHLLAMMSIFMVVDAVAATCCLGIASARGGVELWEYSTQYVVKPPVAPLIKSPERAQPTPTGNATEKEKGPR
ncbi:MAG TPA: hypothetical protein VHX14_10515 [Thermoanaerobaculia bacterium]|nr:hypothetical protein [Thermoanaerobaculia bacterium]